jgi:hypothetical protein
MDKDGFPIYIQSLFPSFDAPEWLDAKQEWCVGLTYCTNYGAEWHHLILNGGANFPMLRSHWSWGLSFSNIEIKWNIEGICIVQLSHFHNFSVILSFIHFFKMSNSIVECFLQSLRYSMCGEVLWRRYTGWLGLSNIWFHWERRHLQWICWQRNELYWPYWLFLALSDGRWLDC